MLNGDIFSHINIYTPSGGVILNNNNVYVTSFIIDTEYLLILREK